MLKLILIFSLTICILSQSQATLTQPPLIETNTYTLRKISKNITSPTTTLTYMQTYTNAPQVFVSIVNLQSFTPLSVVSYSMSVSTITSSNFIVEYIISCLSSGISCTFTQIVIDYLAFDFPTYPFVQILEESFIIDPTFLTKHQFYQINYMNQLTHGHSYSLGCMLSGIHTMTISTGMPYFYIGTQYYNRHSFFLQVKFDNVTIISFDFIRVLIDETMMNLMSTGPSSLTCDIGVIVHYSDPNVVENNPTPDFLPFAVFFGVSGFGGWGFSLTNLVYIFNNTIPRIQANMGYILFLTSSCPSNQLYVTAENLCYGLSSAFYYQATPATMLPCPYSCYQCIGPLTTQCRSCVTGWNRVLSGGRCVCISGFYDPGAPTCKNCTQAIAGCKTCSSATNCLTCLSGCTAIGFNPIYCDCPNNIQTNSSYNCPKTYYFDYNLNNCTCLPQTYFNSASKMCFPCATGCYICAKNISYCISCIDSYTLIDNTCIFFYTSYALLGQTSNYNDPKLRCLRWDQSSGSCLQRCKYYYYQANCYSKCPQGTFNISFPWLTCQPCQHSCQFCFNYTICYQCATTYYYFNTSILSCSSCSPNCVKCTNASYCSQCQTYYELIGGYCFLPTIPTPTCGDGCNYCLISHQCLQCVLGYFLNISSQLCVYCAGIYGLQMRSDGCQQLCGDGKLINDQCDDGNTNSGDGCSSSCIIQNGYQCKQINGTSRCWSRSIAVDWQIFAMFGNNNIIISFNSRFPLSTTFIDLVCGFKNTIIKRASVNGREQFTVLYKQSVLLMEIKTNDANTINHLSNSLTKNRCSVTFNQLQTFIFQVNIDPQLFLINYGSTLESVNNGNTMKMFDKFAIYFTLATSFFGLSPMTSYASMRFFILFLVTFMQYMHIPNNAFSSYQSFQLMLFITPSTTTREMTTFTSEYYIGILWHLLVVYIGFIIWLEVGVNFILKMSRGNQWAFMIRLFALVSDNKQIAYQNMYICYEVVIWCVITKVFANINQASSILIFLVSLHFIFIITSKIHFYFTYDSLQKNYPQFTHTMIIQQLQNICIAFVSMATTSQSSYTPVIMILFAIYPLLSLNRNSPGQPKEETYHISIQMTIWQMRVSYIFQIIIQCYKLAYMWCGNIMTSQEQYESVGPALGLCIGLFIQVMMVLGTVNSGITYLIRICEAKNQGRATIPSNQNFDMHTVDASSHAQ